MLSSGPRAWRARPWLPIPNFADGQVWLAVSLGYQARIKGVLWARWQGFPDQAKAALRAAVAAEPDNPIAVSALGGWQVEVVKAGGPFLARQLFGASLSEAMSLFDRRVRAGARQCRGALPDRAVAGGLDPVAPSRPRDFRTRRRPARHAQYGL